jgi:hypothetical protein
MDQMDIRPMGNLVKSMGAEKGIRVVAQKWVWINTN